MSNPETVVEYTIEALRSAIREGKLAQGQRLVVADVTRMLGVSNGPVREAIRRLTGEGLVEIVPHRGAAVRVFASRDLHEIFQVREVLEGLAARLASERVTAGDYRARLNAVMEEMRNVRGAEFAYIESNHKFHELIYEVAGNGHLQEQARQLVLPIYKLRFHHLMDPDYARVSAEEHETIAHSILNGDGPRSERAMRTHIRNSGLAMVEAVSSQQENDAPLAIHKSFQR